MEVEITRVPVSQVEDAIARTISIEPGPSSLSTSELLTRVVSLRERENKLMKFEEVQKTMMKKCKPPISRKFGHPCNCGSNYNNQYSKQRTDILINSQPTNGSELLPSIAYSAPMYLYDPSVKKCLPTSRSRDMLMRDCHPNGLLMANFHMRSQPPVPQSGTCYYSDLVCDSRRFRCVCKQPSLHLYYSNESSPVSFGCVPLDHTMNIENHCKQGQFYNVITRECQKMFDPVELSSNLSANTATQMSFASVVLIWIFLLIVILVAKLRKLKRNDLYGGGASSSQFERRSYNHYHYQPSSSEGPPYRSNRPAPSWLHPIFGIPHAHRYHRRTEQLDSEHIQHRDTEVFLGQSRRRFNEILNTGQNFSGSELSINTPPPPKFDEIYPPSCPRNSIRTAPDPPPAIARDSPMHFQPPPHPPPIVLSLPSNDDLPTYDEAMKMDDTAPKAQKQISTTTTTSQNLPPRESSNSRPIATSTNTIIDDSVTDETVTNESINSNSNNNNNSQVGTCNENKASSNPINTNKDNDRKANTSDNDVTQTCNDNGTQADR